jgi:hypothetical protein
LGETRLNVNLRAASLGQIHPILLRKSGADLQKQHGRSRGQIYPRFDGTLPRLIDYSDLAQAQSR